MLSKCFRFFFFFFFFCFLFFVVVVFWGAWLGALHRRSEFANFCHNFIQNHLSKLVPMYKYFYSSHWFLNNQMFLLFPIVETNANYAEICRAGNLEVIFQQVPLVQFF